VRILLISGSLREGSMNTAALMTAQRLVSKGVEAILYRGMGSLPHFNPDHDREGEQVDATVADRGGGCAGAVYARVRRRVAWCVEEPAGVDGRRWLHLSKAGRVDQRVRTSSANGRRRRARLVAQGLGYVQLR